MIDDIKFFWKKKRN